MALLITDGQIHNLMNTYYNDYIIAQMEKNLNSHVLDSIKKPMEYILVHVIMNFMNLDNTNISDKFSSKKINELTSLILLVSKLL